MKKLATVILTGMGVVMMSGCGGGSNDGTIPPQNNSISGTFIDVPIKNLKYVTPTLNGYTDKNGKYRYKEGEKVKFYLGDMLLGEIEGGEIITPFSLAGDDDISNPSQATKNIARLLQSLDSNQTDEDRILLPESVKSLHIEGDIASLTEADMNQILTDANSATTLIDETVAVSKLKVYVKNVLETPQNKITLDLLTQNPWYVIEYDNGGAYCNGIFTYTDTDLTVEYKENGQNVVLGSLRYTLLNGKLITVHDGKVETETLSSHNDTSLTVDKKAVNAVTGVFRNQMQKKWFIDREDALNFSLNKGVDCSNEM